MAKLNSSTCSKVCVARRIYRDEQQKVIHRITPAALRQVGIRRESGNVAHS